MDFFLKAKSWQIFLLIVCVPFGIQSILLSFLIPSVENNPELLFKGFIKIFPVITLIFMGIFFLWFWSLGVGLNKRISEEFRPKVKFFKFGIIYSAMYIVIFLIFFVLVATSGEGAWFMAFLFPLHFFAMYCIFHALYFICKNLVTHEKQQTVEFSSFSGPFFLLWFFPIGIWFIQPRINKVYETKNT